MALNMAANLESEGDIWSQPLASQLNNLICNVLLRCAFHVNVLAVAAGKVAGDGLYQRNTVIIEHYPQQHTFLKPLVLLVPEPTFLKPLVLLVPEPWISSG